jgi:hypothetical protein
MQRSAGRPKGSRNKLSEDFLSVLCADFEEHGPAAVVTMRENDPSSYVKVVAGLVPKDMNVNMTGSEGLKRCGKRYQREHSLPQLKGLHEGRSHHWCKPRHRA